MPDTLTQPTSFEAANTWLASRRNLPTVLDSAGLAMLPELRDGARMHAFYSARVSSSSILEALRKEVDTYAAEGYDLAGARARLKTFLAGQGISPDDVGWADKPPAGLSEEDWKAAKKITNIGSTSRLNLILRQNARQAWMVGRKEISEHPAVKQRWPYYRYLAQLDGDERDDHGALHNLVLRKDDPFWGSHTPPWDYNCRCDIEDADDGDIAETGGTGTVAGTKVLNPGTGRTQEILPPPSGYAWDPAAAMNPDPAAYDWTAIDNAALREAARAQAEDIASNA